MRLIFLFAVAAGVVLPSGRPPEEIAQDKLSEDARVAVVVDAQGTATVRPVGRERWTPVGPHSVLLPGDQVRTPVRGANAAELRLTGGGSLVLGPGGLVEIVSVGVVRLYRGEVELTAGVHVEAPGEFSQQVKETLVLRSDGQRTEVLEQAPRWLTGYRGSTTDEWMGSLVAQVDGRDVPLSVGYHKVTVDIRDQIARTTVEQSFVNSTNSTLEGVFYFPLPADASISGFGMWIGDELVEADIVEKQRARAIYEDILRRRKDPGLLEWSGGNLFKARVFPIFPHSEKRIQIRYTQVLPLEGSTMRYRYALRSELLRARPLRELDLTVRVSSEMEILKVASPSHALRVRHTEHAASAEFQAEEFSPERDFELAVDLDRTASLTAVPHRRGEDGYFMLLLSPDGPQQVWERELLPENGPVDVLFVADTSGSMDAAARSAQSEFISAFLSLLGTRDRFRLMTCDVEPRWFLRDPAPVTEERIDAALDFLASRPSLGWTDLERAFADLRVAEDTLVIYVGDGIGTVGDADPTALAQRLRRLQTEATFHTVFTSSTYEKVVLEAMASLGGGSVRAVGDAPAHTAYRLLAEVAQPAVKNLRVEFEGLRTARVYPEQLPNLSAGTQQVVLGRFLPEGGRQSGKVVVTGSLDGKPVRYAADLTIDEGEAGNSFIPRLWARRHIDTLLEEGTSQAIQEEIVSFSEEFGVMTPYTSFLVLENDADRERYGVQRRVKMRDGERFFAEGRDRAAAELLAQQMKAARTWRLDLRRRMLAELATLGVYLHDVAVGWSDNHAFGNRVGGLAGKGLQVGASMKDVGGESFSRQLGDKEGYEELDEIAPEDENEQLLSESEADPDLAMNMPAEPQPSTAPVSMEMAQQERAREYAGAGAGRRSEARLDVGNFRGNNRDFRGLIGGQTYRRGFGDYGFPPLSDAPAAPPEFDAPDWPEGIRELLTSLDRRAALKTMRAAVSLRMSGGTIHALRGHQLRRDRAEGVLRADGWFVRGLGQDQEPIDQWMWAGRRGVLASGVRLGRSRAEQPRDRELWPFPLRDSSMQDLTRTYAAYAARVVGERDSLVTVLLTAPGSQDYRVRLVIDRDKRVLVELQAERDRTAQRIVRFSDFAEAAGQWWARRIEELDGEGRVVGRYSLEVEELSGTASANALHQVVAGHGDVVFVNPVDPGVDAAKQAAHDKKADFADQFALAIHFAASGQWDRVWEHWELAEAAIPGKPGARWLRATLFSQGRRGEALKELLSEIAADVARTAGPATGFLALRTVGLAGSVLQAQEMLVLLDVLRPAFQTAGERGRTDFIRRRAQWLSAAGHPAEALELFKQVAEARPFETQAVMDYLNALRQADDRRGAIELAARAIETQKWSDYEAQRIYDSWTQSLWELRQLRDLLGVLESWIARSPSQETAYQRWLSTLLYLDRENEADAWVAARLGETVSPDLNQAGRSRLGAAIQYALGHGWNYWQQRIEERWHQPLADLGLRLVRIEDPSWYLAARILNDGRFARTDAGVALRKGLVGELTDEALASMQLATLGRYLNWIPWGRNDIDEEIWQRVLQGVRQRWSGAEDNERINLAAHVLHLLDARGETAGALDFLRERLAAATDEVRPQIVNQLLNRLVGQPWSSVIEDEILALIPKLQPVKATEEQRQNLDAATVRWVADRLERGRYEALLGPAAEREKLTRKALAHKRSESRKRARVELSARLLRESRTSRARRWFQLEQLTLLAKAGEDLAAVNGEVRELLSAFAADSDRHIEQLLRERCAFIIAYLATRSAAAPALADTAVELFAQRLAAEPMRQDAYRIDWRYHQFRLLVALDRPAQLAEQLAAWIVPSEVDSRWRIAHGYLLAETGRLEEAITVFEGVADRDELGSAEYAVLANWYLVTEDSARREVALDGQYRTAPEHELYNLLNLEINKVSRRGEGIPAELDPEAVRIMKALLSKATRPANYIWQVQQLYSIVKDFRLLESLADGVIGHSAEGIYPFLEQVGPVISGVHEEATCDTLITRVAELAENARGVDRRALLLIQVLVQRRAAEVLNQAGPHAERGLAALRRAFDGSWLPGERRLMASFLASLGAIRQPAFAAEQIRQLTELYRDEDGPAFDRLNIAASLFSTRWAYGAHDRALDGLAAALSEFRAASGGVLPTQANPMVETLIGWYEARARHRLAETWLRAELAAAHNVAQRSWLTQRLFQVYVHCLGSRGAVAIGRGAELYRAARTEMEEWMFAGGPDQIVNTVSIYSQLHYNAVHTEGIGTAGRDFERFARETLPELLTVLPGNVQSVVSTVASMLEQLNGPRSALAFLIDRLEAEPRWYARVNQGGWRHFAYNLARWRSASEPLGSLEPRLLKIVLTELERDLLTMQQRSRVIYQINNSYFWREKAGEFRAVTMRVIAENQNSPARLLYAADYLWGGLRLRREAIATLLAAEQRQMLREDGRHRLVTWLHAEKRYGESLPLLAILTTDRPDRLDYRTLKIRALHEVDRDNDAIAYLDETEQRFRDNKAWNEHTIATLGDITLTCEFHERSVTYYEEVIPLHQRTQPNRGIGNGTLSHYYGQIARAYVAIGNSDKAVDAASAAVVSWGRTHYNRQSALQSLQAVIQRIPDLDAYVLRREAQVRETGMDAPVLRKAIGQVYLSQRQPQKAIPQLLAARTLQPNDVETHEALLTAYDKLGRQRDACDALQRWIHASPMKLVLYENLGKRLAALGESTESERAWTTLVEVQPNEAESHRMLAQIRERQQLYTQAVVQWQQVVRCRTDEPEGWLSLSQAQVRAGDKRSAVRTLREVMQRSWDQRFGDVRQRAAQILAPLSKPPR